MQVVYERCGGLDVHKRTVVACVLVTHPDGTVHREVQTLGTMSADLLALSDWLRGRALGVLAMESTGVYWKPVYNLLEEGRQILLVNPQHLQTVPGRKTDVKDSEWLADPARATACCRRVSSRPSRCATCANSPATARRWSRSAPRTSTGCRTCWRAPM